MIKPLGAMLLVKELITEDKTTKSGLIISHVIEHGLKQGEVLAKGDGDHNFEGGELVFNNLNIQIKPKPGLLVIYDPTELHSVKKVYNNDRYCIGSAIDIIKNSI